MTPRFWTLVMMVLTAAASRLVPHPPNFTPIGALALFSCAHFSDKRLAFAVPLAALFLGDLAMGLYAGMIWVYASFVLIGCIGLSLRNRRRAGPIIAATLASSLLFYAVTNFGVWAAGVLYPRTAAGFLECYVAAIPFFGNTLLGDGVYSAVLFGGFALAEYRFHTLRQPALLASASAGFETFASK